VLKVEVMSVVPWTIRRLAASVTLVAWLMGLAAPLVEAHHVDIDCDDVLWTSDHQRTAFEDVRPPLQEGHCELCHHQRLLRSLDIGSRVARDSDAVTRVVSALPGLVPRPVALTSLPPRAPPVSI
jgi:hypothetical protein